MTHVVKSTDKNSRYKLIPIKGECLQAVGINKDGDGFAVVDTAADFKIGDVVVCSKYAGMVSGYIKQVKEINGYDVVVGTAYLDPSRDFNFVAAEIRGVVVETYGKLSQYREYKRKTR